MFSNLRHVQYWVTWVFNLSRLTIILLFNSLCPLIDWQQVFNWLRLYILINFIKVLLPRIITTFDLLCQVSINKFYEYETWI